MKKGLPIVLTIIIILLLAGGFYAFKLYEKEKEGWKGLIKKYEEKNLGLFQDNQALSDSVEVWKYNAEEKELALEEERLSWQMEVKTYLNQQSILSDQITKFKNEKARLEELLAGSQQDNGEEYANLLEQRDRLEELIVVEQQKGHELLLKIEALKSQIEIESRRAISFMDNLNSSFFTISGDLLAITRMSDHLGYLAKIAHIEGKGVKVLNDIEGNVQMVRKDVASLRARISGMEYRMEQYESKNDSIVHFSSAIGPFRSQIQNILYELNRREEQSAETEALVNKRYLLIAPTDSLEQWGLLIKRGFLKKGYDFTGDFSKVEKSKFNEISKGDKSIVVPFNRIDIEGVLTSQSKYSYSVEPSTIDPGVSEITFIDKNEFYKASLFVVVELSNKAR